MDSNPKNKHQENLIFSRGGWMRTILWVFEPSIFKVAGAGFEPMTPSGYEQKTRIRTIWAVDSEISPNRRTLVQTCLAGNDS